MINKSRKFYNRPQRIFINVESGFTLIEILVATMILAICLSVILQLFSGGLKALAVSKSYNRAVAYARVKMEELLLMEEYKTGEYEGSFTDGYSWHATIVQDDRTKNEDRTITPFSLYNLQIKVMWSEGAKEREVVLKTVHMRETSEEIDGQ